MTKEEFDNKYELVPEKEKGTCSGCVFKTAYRCRLDEDHICDEVYHLNMGCVKDGVDCVYVKKTTSHRLNAFEEIANRFEEWSGDQSHNGDDMADVAKDVINADNAYLLWQIEDLASLDADEFKQEVLKVIIDFKCSIK